VTRRAAHQRRQPLGRRGRAFERRRRQQPRRRLVARLRLDTLVPGLGRRISSIHPQLHLLPGGPPLRSPPVVRLLRRQRSPSSFVARLVGVGHAAHHLRQARGGGAAEHPRGAALGACGDTAGEMVRETQWERRWERR
jgi:hypothetical protein